MQAPAVQSSLSAGDKATCFLFIFFFLSAPTFFSLCFGCFCNKSAYPGVRYISFLSGCVTCTRQKGRFSMTAGFWLQQADRCYISSHKAIVDREEACSVLARSLQLVFSSSA